MSRERTEGRILSVWTENPGTTLTADAAASATVLEVDDVSPFNGADSDDGPGGTLQVGDQVVAYLDIDDDASTITLAAPLPTAVTLASENADVLRWNDLYNQVDSVQRALVQPSGKRWQEDPVEAVVADTVEGLVNSDRGGPGEPCELVRDGDEWEIVRVKGRPAGSGTVKFYDLDTFTAALDGAQAYSLTYEPIPGSVHMAWNGLWQPHAEFTVNGAGVTVPDPSGLILAGDVLDFRYAYRDGIVTPVAQYGPVPTCASGITMTGAHIAGTSGTWYFTALQDTSFELGVVERLTDGTYRAYFTHVGYPIAAGQTSIVYPVVGSGEGGTAGATPVGLYMKSANGGSHTPAADAQRGVQDPANCAFYFGAAWTPGNAPGGPLT